VVVVTEQVAVHQSLQVQAVLAVVAVAVTLLKVEHLVHLDRVLLVVAQHQMALQEMVAVVVVQAPLVAMLQVPVQELALAVTVVLV
jgi:hypothetical protein